MTEAEWLAEPTPPTAANGNNGCREGMPMNLPVKTAWTEAVNNGDFVCIETYSGYRSSRRDPRGKQHLLAPDASNVDLGIAVLDCLANSRFVRPDEDSSLYDFQQTAARYCEWVERMMAAYGYKNRRALFKKMKSCSIHLRDGKLIVRPTRHEQLEGWSGDGIAEQDCVIIHENSSPENVGEALRLAFSRCK